MTSKQLEKLIEKLEKCKTSKSAKKILNQKGIKTEEGFNKSYDFYINNKHYRVVKHKNDDTCKVIKYRTMIIQSCKPRIAPSCYGYETVVAEEFVYIN